MAILSQQQAKTLNYPRKKWILHKMLFNKDTWAIHEAVEYVSTQLPGQGVPSYICISRDKEFEPSHWFNFSICPQVMGATFKSHRLKNDIELVFQFVN